MQEKTSLVLVDKRGFFHGGEGGIRPPAGGPPRVARRPRRLAKRPRFESLHAVKTNIPHRLVRDVCFCAGTPIIIQFGVSYLQAGVGARWVQKMRFALFQRSKCSGKLLLDTKGVFFVQMMVYWRTSKNTSLYKGSQTRTGGLP